MSTWTTKAHNLRATQAQLLANILTELNDDDPRTIQDAKYIASPAGSERALRGIPVVGARGVGGTVRGTSPLQALVAKQPRNDADRGEQQWPRNPQLRDTVRWSRLSSERRNGGHCPPAHVTR